MKRICSAANLPEAHLLMHLLASHGIRAHVLNAHASSGAGELPIDAALPQVWVERPEEADRARQLVDGFFRSRPQGGPVKCPACGEENPPAFDLCWKCGAGLEAHH